ncbi:MAG: phospho-N-acetylmuramoyl-pentapeptide-transferase [Halobacteriovoraceae bacterium]|nr:phospho-N-acetylmuramoyl-pentapeptide-transferase [Halobacteriovoraceae bacterium]
MLYHFLAPLGKDLSLLNVFRYITFRSFIGFALASLLSVWLGRKFIAYMKSLQFEQSIRDNGPQSHMVKKGTPTMGGILIVGVAVGILGLLGNFTSPPFLICLGVGLSYFFLGWLDDYLKVVKKNSDGVSAKMKLLWQFATAFIAAWIMIHFKIIDTTLYFPFLKDVSIDLGWFYILFVGIVIVGSSNAVNLTDGLDGLAVGPIITSIGTLSLLAYLAGHQQLSQYLLIPYTPGAGELTVMGASIIGACVGFLWYNSYPAQIFMGDVGSLSLGGFLGTMAVLTKNEILFVLIGGVFVMEALSVIIQVGSFKLRKKRVFKMAPIHHHFELKGWKEPKVIVRFWIISLVLAVLSLASLKLR